MTDPIVKFAEWYEDARKHPVDKEPTAMSLATASKNGIPSVRIVLLKSVDARGFVFYTNFESRKSEELKNNPQAALCFNWISRGRQVRVEGSAEPVSEKEADAYFASRPLMARIGAIASEQSRPLPSRDVLEQKIDKLLKRYSESNPPPRPEHWSGWRVVPRVIEFWQSGEARLHDREVFTRESDGWKVERLYP